MLSDIDIKILYMLQMFERLIAQTYRGGVEILESDNPEKIVYSAHAMRELIHMLIELDKVLEFGKRKKSKNYRNRPNMNIEGIRRNLNPRGILTEEFERHFDVLIKEKMQWFTSISHHSESPPIATYGDELNEFKSHLLGVLELHFRTKKTTDVPVTELDDDITPDEAIKFLRSYGSKGSQYGYLDALGKKFQDDVQNKPNEFAKLASQIINLNSAFVSRFFDGMRKAAEQKQSIDWKPILSLCEEIIESEKQGKPQKYRIFHYIADTINTGIGMDSIDFALRNRVWDLLKFLVNLEYTDQFMEEMYPNYGWHSFQISKNTVNGITFHCILSYAIWCDSQSTDKVFAPEVKELFSDYLDHKIPPSVSKQAVLGYYLPVLYYFDKEWIRDGLDKLFTSTSESLSRSAWEGHLANDVYRNTFMDLIDRYDAHIQKLKDPPLERYQLWEIDMRVIEHVTIAYLFKIDGAKKLFDSMVLHSHEKVLAHCAQHISLILKRQKEKSYEFFDIDAFREIWRNSKFPTKKEIYHWFEYSPLDKMESLELFSDSLERLDAGMFIPFPFEELMQCTRSNPELALKCLNALVKKKSGWESCNTEDETKVLLRILLDDARTKEGATELVRRLLKMGFVEYKDLLE